MKCTKIITVFSVVFFIISKFSLCLCNSSNFMFIYLFVHVYFQFHQLRVNQYKISPPAKRNIWTISPNLLNNVCDIFKNRKQTIIIVTVIKRICNWALYVVWLIISSIQASKSIKEIQSYQFLRNKIINYFFRVYYTRKCHIFDYYSIK